MAVPKNRNIRKITVDSLQYYWSIKYDEDYGIIQCNIGLVNKPSYRFRFIRTANKSHVRYILNGIEDKDEVEVITPKLVAEAIKFANNSLDWKNNFDNRIVSNSKGFSIE